MRPRPHRLVALALAGRSRPALDGASRRSRPRHPPPGAAGSWEGWAKLTNDWPGQVCRYDGGPGAPSVRLELTVRGGALQGSVAIDLPAEPGVGLPAAAQALRDRRGDPGRRHRVLHRRGRQRVDARRCGGTTACSRACSPGARAGPSSRSPRASRVRTASGRRRGSTARCGCSAAAKRPGRRRPPPRRPPWRRRVSRRRSRPRGPAVTSATWVSSSAPTWSRSACSTGRTSSARAARTPGS